MIALDRTGARQGRARPERRPVGRLVAGGAVALLLLSTLAAQGIAASEGRPRGGGQAAAAAQRIDPRLMLRPRTLTQVVMVGGLRLALTAGPLVPGPNRLVISLAENGHAVTGAQVRLRAVMVGMIMQPFVRAAAGSGRGRYRAVVPLSMFGPWQLTLHVARRHRAPLAHTFELDLDLPAALMAPAPTTTHR